jgi:hypothetical protein
MALTLVQAANEAFQRGETLRAAVIEIYARESDILRVLPFQTIAGNALRYNQESALPGIGFRGVNEGYTESHGVTNPIVENLAIAGGDLDVDKFITTTMGAGMRTSQEMMKVKALAGRWSHAFIKGASTTDPRELDGLQVRLGGNQLVAAGSTSGGNALSLAKLDEVIDRVDNPQYLLMSKAMKRRLTQAARNPSVSGYITYTKDEFGRTVTQYNGLPILIADNNGDLYQTLAFNEANPGGGSSVGTSIYVLSFGDALMTGIQSGPMQVRDLGELEAKPSERTRVEWYAGLALFHPRSAARLWGISDAAVVV